MRREAIDRRFTGDLLEYGQDLVRLPIAGCKPAVVFNLLFLGLLAPFTLKFEPIPVSENLRFPTQRIRVSASEHACHS